MGTVGGLRGPENHDNPDLIVCLAAPPEPPAPPAPRLEAPCMHTATKA